MVAYCPEGSALTVPVATLAELLAEVEAEAAGMMSDPGAVEVDLTVADVARAMNRSESAVRGWLGAGEIPEAYRMNNREWRVPREAFAAFIERKRGGREPGGSISGRTQRRRGPVDLGAWRKVGAG